MGLIKRDRVQLATGDVEGPRAARPGGGRSGPHAGPKSARLVRLEGRVVGIEFTCSCGQASLIEIDFEGRGQVDPEGQPPADPEEA